MKLFDRVKSWVQTDQGSMNTDWGHGWWQADLKPATTPENPDVSACISMYKRALTAVPIRHVVRNSGKAGSSVNNDSALAAILHRPNLYMSTSELVGVFIDNLLRRGEAVAYIEHDGRGRPMAIHPLPSATMIIAEDGSVFYQVNFADAQNSLARELGVQYIPQRNIVHARWEVNPLDPTRPLAPLAAYATAIGLGSAIRNGQKSFHTNKSMPSGILTTTATLTKEQATQLKSRWDELSVGMHQGKVPILSNGLQWNPISHTANDAQLIQVLGFTTKDIAKAFGVPYALLGDPSGTTYNNSEVLINTWRTTGLLSLCVAIERAFEFSFGLDKNEEMVIDIADLARSESLAQADMLTKLVLNGVMTPNEGRAKLDLAPIVGVADTLVAQQQIQPLQQTADQSNTRLDLEVRQAEHAMEAPEPKPAVEAPHSEPQKSVTPEETSVVKQPSVDEEQFNLLLKGIFA